MRDEEKTKEELIFELKGLREKLKNKVQQRTEKDLRVNEAEQNAKDAGNRASVAAKARDIAEKARDVAEKARDIAEETRRVAEKSRTVAGKDLAASEHFRVELEEAVVNLAVVREQLTAAKEEVDSKLKKALEDLTATGLIRNGLAQQLERRTEDLKKANQDLKVLAARLEHSNAELQNFAFIASHDLQEPLRKIVAFGDRLKANFHDVLGEVGLDYLTRMQSAATRMSTLLQALLDYSRVTTRVKPFARIELSRVAEDAVSDYEIAVESAGAQVEIGEMPTLEADPDQMRQLFQNLICNSLRYHREDEKPRVRIYGSVENGFGHIFVEDNGIGFDEKYLDRIFKPLQRLHGRNAYEGTGMGLAICRKIVERHGGAITAKSVPGKGSTFIVRLPVQQKSSSSEENDQPTSATPK